MKLGYPNKRQNPEEQWHSKLFHVTIQLKSKDVNKDNHRFEVGHREDRPKRGGKHHQNYNRRGGKFYVVTF